MKHFITLFFFTLSIHIAFGQIKYVNREVAQKNYEGYILMQDGKYKEALVFFDSAIEQDSNAYFVYQNRALCKQKLNDIPGAISDFKKNIKLEPTNAETLYALGKIYKDKKDTLEASTFFNQSIKLADEKLSKIKLVYMHQFLGNVAYKNNIYEDAIPHYSWITKSFPEKSKYYVKLGFAYFMTDSMKQTCDNLKQAYIYGEAVPFKVLTSLCPACSDMKEKRIKQPLNVKAIDSNLFPMLKEYSQLDSHQEIYNLPNSSVRKKIYFNDLWEITEPENASYYRDVIWSLGLNFYAGSFTDYYLNDSILASGIYNHKALDKAYKMYHPNGQIAAQGEFNHGVPIGIWNFYFEDGSPWIQIKMEQGDVHIFNINDKDGNNLLNKGTGEVDIQFANAKNKGVVIQGQLLEYGKDGEWRVSIDGKILLQEFYKKGTFKRGIIHDNKQKIRTTRSNLTGWIFRPPYLNKAEEIKFENENTIFNYLFLLNSKK